MSSEQTVVELQPGGISKPMRVWCGSNTVRIGFFQAYPISPSFNIFYKKTGSVFGSEITTQASAIVGPDLSVRQPTSVMAQYFEMEIRKLKPNTQYLIKVKTDNNVRVNARSDKIATISVDEQRTRDADMANFAGSLVKLGDNDGSVLRFEKETGLFHIRILQVDNVQNALQLVRLQSDYSDNGLPVNAYTLSQVKFGRWGGEISSSKIVSEGELKWIVARAVQLEERSESQEGYDARMKVLQLQADKMQAQMQAESKAQVKKLRLRTVLLLVLSTLMALLLISALSYSYIQTSARQRTFNVELESARRAATALQDQLEELQMYRLSLELDSAWRLLPGDNSSAWRDHLAATTATAAVHSDNQTAAAVLKDLGSSSSSDGNGSSSNDAAPKHRSRTARVVERLTGSSRRGGGGGAGGGKGAGSSSSSKGGTAAGGGKGSAAGGSRGQKGSAHGGGNGGVSPPEAQRLMGDEQIKKMLRRSHRLPTEFKQGTQWVGPVPDEEPHAWSFIHQVSNQYALYVQEWMKVQLSRAIRNKVNDMLVDAPDEEVDEDEMMDDVYA